MEKFKLFYCFYYCILFLLKNPVDFRHIKDESQYTRITAD